VHFAVVTALELWVFEVVCPSVNVKFAIDSIYCSGLSRPVPLLIISHAQLRLFTLTYPIGKPTMSRLYKNVLPALLVSAGLLSASALSTSAMAGEGHESNRIVLYFTRHAEKQTVVRPVSGEEGKYMENCDYVKDRCEEELSDLGQKRAELLAEWFERKGITPDITHVVSSDKQRTRQTVQPIADLVNEYPYTDLPDGDSMPDGVWQVPLAGDMANEVTSNSGSVGPTVDFINDLPMGSVAVIAGHSGTLYRIFGGEQTDGTGGLGINTTADSFSFPKKISDGKVPGFGDIWKIVIRPDGSANFKWRKDVDFDRIRVID